MSEDLLEINANGRWVRVPALRVDGDAIVTRGKWLKVAGVHDEIWLDHEVNDPEACIRALQQRPRVLRADIFSFTQMPSSVEPKFPYAFERDSIAAIPLTSFTEWWESLPQESRKNVRRAQKRGVEIRTLGFTEELIRAIAEVNNDSPTRQRERNYHYGKSLEQVRKDHESFLDRSDFVCAFAGAEVIGYSKIVYRGKVASILNFAPKASQQDKRPANAMMAKLVELCAARGVEFITYGMYNYGNKRESPLRVFKDRNGFREVLVPRYYVPLTARGALSIRLHLHRGLLEIVPSGLIRIAVNGRAKWYSVKQWISRCSLMSERPNCNRQMERSNPPAGSNF